VARRQRDPLTIDARRADGVGGQPQGLERARARNQGGIAVPRGKLLWPFAFCLALTLSCTATGVAKPTARYVVRPSSPVAGQATTFDASLASCARRPCTYRWSVVSRSVRGPRLRRLGRGRVLRHTFQRSGVRYLRLTVRDNKGRRSSRTKRIVVSDAPAPAPTPTPLSESPLSLEEVDGGTAYYRQFSSALPTDPAYFPIAVWGSYNHTEANRNLDADVGLNTYVWVADSSFMPAIRQDGRFRVIQDQGERTNLGSETAGWLLADELDMTEGPSACTGTLRNIKSSLPDDGRLRYTNYGKGVLLTGTDAEAGCFVNAQDVTSSDLYWFTDPWQQDMIGEPWLPEGERQLTISEVRRASNYGYQVDRMRALDARDGQRQPIWNFVEVGWPFDPGAPSGARAIAPAELRAAVWHSLIAGARGIIYFQHSFGGPCRSHHALRDPCYADVRAAVKSTNAQIKSLAPVLNSPTVTGLVAPSSHVRTMAKWQGGKFYVFAGNKENSSASPTFDLRCVGDATAVVEGENRSIPVTGGRFQDQFADGNAVHIYRIDGGSTCGLPTGTAQPAPGRGALPRPRGLPRRTSARVGRLPRRVSLRSRRLVVPVRCMATCTVRSRLTMRNASRRILLAAHQRRFAAGGHQLPLHISKRARRRMARARRPHRPLFLRLRTIIVQPRGGGARRTQHLVTRRR
jgi:hypothetical protein